MFFNISWIFRPIPSFFIFFSSSLLRREAHKCAPREIHACGLQINVDSDVTPESPAVESLAFSKLGRDNDEKKNVLKRAYTVNS